MATTKVTKKKTTKVVRKKPATSSSAAVNNKGKKKKPTSNTTTNRPVRRQPNNNNRNRTNNNNARRRQNRALLTNDGKPNKTLIMVWVLVAAELLLDFITTIISFAALVKNGETVCCGEAIDPGRSPLAITTIFLLITFIELVLLIQCIRLCMQGKYQSDGEGNNDNNNTTRGNNNCCQNLYSTILPGGIYKNVTTGQGRFRIVNILVILNPFFGFFVAYMLLDRANKDEAFSVLALECLSMLLHWISVYLEGSKQTKWTLLLHALPMIPFIITIVLIIILLQEGGICYLTGEDIFWINGCEICTDTNLPPNPITGECSVRGTFKTYQGSYCSNNGDIDSFCFYKY